MAFAGMDIGTSGCKLLVYDLDGNLLFKASRKYRETGANQHRELNGKTVLSCVLETLKEAGEQCPVEIEAISFASLGESVVCVDENQEVLMNSMLTGDCRGIQETEEVIAKYGREKIFDITGLPPNELYGLPKYIWMNRSTEAIKKAKAILFYEDFIGYVLTGQRKVSYSSAARSMAFDIGRKEWSVQFLAEAGILPQQMSEPVPPCTIVGTILPEMAKQLKLSKNMKVIVGGHDQTCAAVGSGLLDGRTGECGMGTCEFMFCMLPQPQGNAYMIENDFTCIPYVLEDKYLTSLEITTCGILKNWARENFLQKIEKEAQEHKIDFFDYIDDLAGSLRTKVMVLPQFGSAGNPDLSMDAYGTITGLTIHTRPEEIYRAILESFAFQMYLSYERLEKTGVDVEEIIATGGGAASNLTLQIRADVFGKKIKRLVDDESGALGCMIMAATGVGKYKSIQEGIERAVKVKDTFLPDSTMHEYYKEKYQIYKRLYGAMHDFLGDCGVEKP